MPSLLEKALKVQPKYKKHKITEVREQEIEVCTAWLEDRVKEIQVAKVMGFKGRNAKWFLATVVKEMFRRGLLLKA